MWGAREEILGSSEVSIHTKIVLS